MGGDGGGEREIKRGSIFFSLSQFNKTLKMHRHFGGEALNGLLCSKFLKRSYLEMETVKQYCVD